MATLLGTALSGEQFGDQLLGFPPGPALTVEAGIERGDDADEVLNKVFVGTLILVDDFDLPSLGREQRLDVVKAEAGQAIPVSTTMIDTAGSARSFRSFGPVSLRP